MTTTERLTRLRRWFVAYFVFQFLVGTWLAVVVTQFLAWSSLPYMRELRDLHPGFVVAYSVLVNGIIFGLALALFSALLQRKNWARIVMLIIAWVSAVSAALGLLTSSAMMAPTGWLARTMRDVNWGTLGAVNAITNIASLVFAVYMIRTLQFDQQVRAEFLSSGDGIPG